MRRILLVDSDNLAHRAFYATYRGAAAPVMSHEGFPTNAIVTWSNMLASLIAQVDPCRVIFGLEGKPVFRRAIYPDYKANREEKPKALSEQLPLINKIVRDSGVEFLYSPEDECDDSLMAFAHASRGLAGTEILIASGDKDFGQVVGGNVYQLKPVKGGQWGRFDAPAIKEAFGVEATQIALFIALMGDSVDNIPGFTGIGPGTAGKILADAPAMDAVIARVAKKTKLSEEQVGIDLARNVTLTTFRDLQTNLTMRGDLLPDVLGELGRLNCTHAVKIWRRMGERFGANPVASEAATLAPVAEAPQSAQLTAKPVQAEFAL